MPAFLCLMLKGEGRVGLLEFQQGQKIKKMGCWSSSKAEKSKRWASGNSGARKIKKLGVGKFRKPKSS